MFFRRTPLLQRGFTIVELLIVVVVIAVLAAITIVSYSGIQRQAHIAKLKAEFSSVEKSMAMYKAEYGKWPICDGTNDAWSECFLTDIANLPGMRGMPAVAASQRNYLVLNISGRWAVRLTAQDGSSCKMGHNMDPVWWGSAPACW